MTLVFTQKLLPSPTYRGSWNNWTPSLGGLALRTALCPSSQVLL